MLGSVLLINSNISRPLVSPIGLEYVGESLLAADISVQILDLSFESDWKVALERTLRHAEPRLIGLSVRNTDDSSFISRKSFLPWIRDVVTEIRKLVQSPIFLGGTGFSTMPEAVLGITHADGGVQGDGEEAMLALTKSLLRNEDYACLSNVVYRHDGKTFCNSTSDVDLRHLPLPRRRLFDNKSYEQLGGMVGIETKRGCPQKCIYCADPIAKGKRLRVRPPAKVVEEFRDLLDQGISWFHLCDSEFNLPITHAKEMCLAIIENGFGDRLHWYCYCSPVPFDRELADLMRRAGCAGINFGVDSLCDQQLCSLGRTHCVDDLLRLVKVLKPGGVIKEGLYPGVECISDELLFYLSPSLGNDPSSLIHDLVADDPRFLVLSSPGEEGSYNYADDDVLSRLIQQGARGAYWDILRQSRYA